MGNTDSVLDSEELAIILKHIRSQRPQAPTGTPAAR